MKSPTEILKNSISWIPARFILIFMGGFAVINAYTMRNVLSIAITEMTYRAAKNGTIFDDTCPSDDKQFTNERLGYKWSEEYQGVILGAFYWGYTLLHIPGAILSAKYGGKYTLSIGILSTAILTLLTPLTIQYGGAGWLIALRVLEGFGEGTTFPALNTLLSAWIPSKERAKAAAFVYGGAQIGNILTHSISGLLIDRFEGWSSPFYFFGTVGVTWFLLFEFLCYKDPESHPFITEKEKTYLKKELQQLSRDKAIKKTPWLKICTSVPMIALVIAQIGHSFGYFTVVTDLPKYMADVLKFKIKENGLYSTLPYIAMWIMSIFFGTISDWMLTKKWISFTTSRKIFTTLAFTVPGVFLVIASYSGCDRMKAVAMFTIAMGFMGAYYSGMKANNLDLSPNFAGAIMALTNGIGAIVGIINPYIIGLITPNRTISEWRNVFYISCGFLTFTNIIYLIWGSAEKQPWDTPEESSSVETGDKDLYRSKNETK
ncbi:putative inorganic phosphate cotransporter [Chironomus tepperi]|uniref:putative inorganic phosphate cotransporter n=1 Tax=Chironomus tepperi TaxID=113505 RepID=UPI00391F66A8